MSDTRPHPFANIFIDPDTDDQMRGEDLFPRSFIVSLDPPSNYFGATTVFLEEGEQYIRNIEDNEDHLPIRHEIGIVLSSIPPSLADAVRTFILAEQFDSPEDTRDSIAQCW